MRRRLSHRRLVAEEPQQVWIVFGGPADQCWQRPLSRGFRHCFPVVADATGWTVLDPLTGRLVVVRLDLRPDFDLPGFYARAGLTVSGPFTPGPPTPRWLPPVIPQSCVSLCRAVLGSGAPFAVTPRGLYRVLEDFQGNRKNILTIGGVSA